jgi:hypothetical protein
MVQMRNFHDSIWDVLNILFQALAIAAAYRSEWPLLIVCPSSMRFAWKTSILKWMPNIEEDRIHVITGGSCPWYWRRDSRSG